jgi:hypothetical protein
MEMAGRCRELKVKRWRQKTTNKNGHLLKRIPVFLQVASRMLDACMAYSSTLKMEAIIVFEASIGLHGVTF